MPPRSKDVTPPKRKTTINFNQSGVDVSLIHGHRNPERWSSIKTFVGTSSRGKWARTKNPIALFS